MIVTTPRMRRALLSAFPELLGYALPAVRLHPRAGAPIPRQSSVGGPLLWPRDEPWPVCSDPHPITKTRPMTDEEIEGFEAQRKEHARRNLAREESRGRVRRPEVLAFIAAGPTRIGQFGITPEGYAVTWEVEEIPAEPVAMIPVVQLFRSEAGDFPFPDGTDLLQILWCPNDHKQWRGPRSVPVWRDSASVGALLDSPPPCTLIERPQYVPNPCVAHPEPIVEFPPICQLADLGHGRLLGRMPAELEQRLRIWDADQPEKESYFYLAHAPGWKIGGWDSSWIDPAHLEDCPCGAPMRPLLEVDRGEFLSCVWSPAEEPHFPWGDPARWQDQEPTGVSPGRDGRYWVLACTADASHALSHSLR
ncbi:hypothetical protein KO481_15590 [Nocardia sp. NEAU-G5]|uniref:DUF1963 domain-containing protein n=1 Tax=Nocardia albiluteola TaxID=2842303 RepID=A0ABS6AY14_9NOCA|nr:hypothetical protein [Nocardia albiluteola]MBU3062942.1 hypothetical protein [Nocardia albiluteola]